MCGLCLPAPVCDLTLLTEVGQLRGCGGRSRGITEHDLPQGTRFEKVGNVGRIDISNNDILTQCGRKRGNQFDQIPLTSGCIARNHIATAERIGTGKQRERVAGRTQLLLLMLLLPLREGTQIL